MKGTSFLDREKAKHTVQCGFITYKTTNICETRSYKNVRGLGNQHPPNPPPSLPSLLPDSDTKISYALFRPDLPLRHHTIASPPVPLRSLQVILRQLVEAVLEIHGRGVVHRDIKLDNVLVQTDASGPLVHVLDFGCGAMLNESPHKFHAGTCLHMPPECYLRSEFHAVPSTVWQLGIVLYQMLTRILPFSTPKEIIYQELYLWQELTNECKDLLQRCLDKRLRGRPTLEEILQHAWFQ
ncbi:serine/threonine-protein kinase pim-2-like [Anguilla rostrata]|uniref:serine/threonine-protein kinase pim-2-like n=1 Tax=Anguilla rostrata TaxID=7938 RepID=UPI0030CB3A2B